MPTVLGIDAGTTNTSASLVLDNQQEIMVNLGPTARPLVMRSAALKLGQDQWLAGDDALNHYETTRRGALITAFKPLLAEPEHRRTIWEPVQTDATYTTDPKDGASRMHGGETLYVLRTESLRSPRCPPGTTLSDATRAAREMLSAVLGKVRTHYQRIAIDNLVIGVPIAFPDLAKEKLMQAAVDAGIVSTRRQIALLHEPVAVALAYGVEHRTPKRVLVFDHGGGTLDISIVDIEGHPNGEFRYRVLGQIGHDRAGRFYDLILLKAILEAEASEGRQALEFLGVKDPLHITNPSVLDAAERVKELLCQRERRRYGAVRFAYPFGNLAFSQEVSEDLFHDVLRDELTTIRSKLESVIEQASNSGVSAKPGTGPGGVEEVLLAGGSAQIPSIRGLLAEIFGPDRVNTKYAGTRTATRGFSRAVTYRKLIDELNDTEYSIHDPGAGMTVPAVRLGTPLGETSVERQFGKEDGFYIRTDREKATVVVFRTDGTQQHPVLQGEIDAQPGEVLQVIVTINRETGRPEVHAQTCTPGKPPKPLTIRTSLAGSQDDPVPILEEGNIIRFRTNKIQPPHGVGCIMKIIRIWDGQQLQLAAGDMYPYRFLLHHPHGAVMNVRTTTDNIELYEIARPRPDERVDLTKLDESRFRPLSQAPYHTFSSVERPAGIQPWTPPSIAKTPAASPLPEDEPPAPAQQPPTGARRTFGDRLRSFLTGRKEGDGEDTIHVHIWLAAALLHEAGLATFTANRLAEEVERAFHDTRPGVKTHISAHCSAVARKNAGTIYNYLFKDPMGEYRLCRASDPIHPSRQGAPLCPQEEAVPTKYRELWRKYGR